MRLLPVFVTAAGAAVYMKRDEGVPPVRPFQRRALHYATVIGHYLYFEAGEVSNYVEGKFRGTTESTALNGTLSIPLRDSFSLANVEFHQIPGHLPPSIDKACFWTDSKNGVMYRYAGDRAFHRTPLEENRHLFKFTPDNKGDGSWSIVDPADEDAFGSFVLPSRMGSAFCPEEQLGFSIGGFGTDSTDVAFKGVSWPTSVNVPGMMRFDVATRSWTNESTLALNPVDGAYTTGEAVCVSAVAKNSVVFVIGGWTGSFKDLGNITMYDPVEKKWLWQSATGSIPRPRENFCIAGAKSKDGTYEIFVHGGRNPADGSLSDTFVLSIPGFRWFSTDLTAEKRMDHSCVVLPKGQLLISGGMEAEWEWKTNDVWASAMGIVDMATLKWSDSYNASLDDYIAPQTIKDWYSKGGMQSISWSSDNVKSLFADVLPSTTPASTSAATTSPTTSAAARSDDATHIGAVVGGVIGGVAALCLIPVTMYLVARRRKKPQSAPLPETRSKTPAGYEVHGASAPQELGGPATARVHEMEG